VAVIAKPVVDPAQRVFRKAKMFQHVTAQNQIETAGFQFRK
jgi:hypothetical protein